MELLDKLTLKQVHYFTVIAEAKSFRQAAYRLNVTQPTLSHQIASLEALLGLQLFERTRSGTHLTIQGRELVTSARRMLEEARGFTMHAGSLSGSGGGTYRLGVTPTLGPYLLPHILGHLHEKYAQLRLYVQEDAPSDLEIGLINSQFDLVMTALPVMSKELIIKPLFREPLKLILPRDHPLARKKRINRMDLMGEEVLTLHEHHLYHRQVTELCERVGAVVRRDYEGTSLDTLRHMVVMGLGISFLPALYVKSEIHDQSDLRVADVDGVNVSRTHALVWRNTSHARQFYRELGDEITATVSRSLHDVVMVPKQSGT